MKRFTDPLNQILKLHRAVEGRDGDKVVPVCASCGGAKDDGEFAKPFPCDTFKVAHKAVNPQIPIADVKKDAIESVKSTGGWDQDAPKVGAAK